MPFTTEEFLNVFEMYNTSVFPFQLLFPLLAVLSVWLLFLNISFSSRIINGVLAFLMLWTGLVYHIIFFTTINKAAYLFGALFIVQAFIFLYNGVINQQLQYKIRKDWVGIIGSVLIIYALIIYPILGYILGHGYPKQPTFGLPCPTTIFTLGILLFTVNKIKWYNIIILLLWSLLGFSAAVSLGIIEDTGLMIAGVLGFTILIVYHRKINRKDLTVESKILTN